MWYRSNTLRLVLRDLHDDSCQALAVVVEHRLDLVVATIEEFGHAFDVVNDGWREGKARHTLCPQRREDSASIFQRAETKSVGFLLHKVGQLEFRGDAAER